MSDDLTPQQRAALVVWKLAYGVGLLLADVQTMTGLSQQAARQLLHVLQQVLDVQQDAEGVWFLASPAPRGVPTSAQARAALLTLTLAQGARLQIYAVAGLVGLRHSAATRLLWLLSLVLPIGPDEQRQWGVFDFGGWP